MSHDYINTGKMKKIHELLEERDMMIILETGVNEDRKTPPISDNFFVDRENKMDKVKNMKYQHKLFWGISVHMGGGEGYIYPPLSIGTAGGIGFL